MARIEAKDRDEAWKIVNKMFPTDYEEDEFSSSNAGYKIYRSDVDWNSYIADLGNRLEINLSDGSTTNVWIGIDTSKDEKIKELEAKVAELTKKLDAELEWKDAKDCGTRMDQDAYEALMKECSGPEKIIIYDQAKERIADEFGFSVDKIEILNFASTYEVNRHNQLRVKKTYARDPLWGASDWNYIRFDVCGWAYEMINGDLYQYID